MYCLSDNSIYSKLANLISYRLIAKRVSLSRLSITAFFPHEVTSSDHHLKLQPPSSTMVQAESSKTAERNGLRAVTAGAPVDYELPWSVPFPMDVAETPS
jgi:hypothetical protein